MKILFLAFVFLIITVSAKAEVLQGSVKQFEGYSALETATGDRIILPKWIDSKILVKDQNHEMLIEGSIRKVACVGQPDSCATGEIQKIKWIQYQNTTVVSRNIVYTGIVKRYKGQAIESFYFYDYIAFESQNQKIEIPAFLNPNKLLELEAIVTLIGEAHPVICTDMSDACGPSKLGSVTMIKIQF
jgi:hypothetical protein